MSELEFLSIKVKNGQNMNKSVLRKLPPEVLSLAKKLAQAYKLEMKARNPYFVPFDLGCKIEETDSFVYFVKVASKLVHQENLDPKQYVLAQFENWNGPEGSLPRPGAMATDNALIRYSEWKHHKEIEEFELNRFKYTGVNTSESDQKNLKRYRAYHPEYTDKQILIKYYDEFTRDILREYKVWNVVKDDWDGEDGKGEDY
jgi:hypothetical protein